MKSDEGGFVYILTNKTNKVLYVGRTSNLYQRIYQHRHHIFPNAFTARYQVYKLVYFEECEDYSSAIHREHQLKAGSRQKKVDLINSVNPQWRDLSVDWDLDDRSLEDVTG